MFYIVTLGFRGTLLRMCNGNPKYHYPCPFSFSVLGFLNSFFVLTTTDDEMGRGSGGFGTTESQWVELLYTTLVVDFTSLFSGVLSDRKSGLSYIEDIRSFR